MTTWKPPTAGVIEIVAGVLHILVGATTILVAGGVAGGLCLAEFPLISLMVPLPLITGIGLPLLVLGTASVVGGISALKRKRWGLALAGGICALVPLQALLGVLAIVFLAMSRAEFE